MVWRSIDVRARDGIGLACDEQGRGTPAVLVHGLGRDRRCWDEVGGALVDAGLRVVRLDLRGCGASEVPPDDFDVPVLAADLEDVRLALGLARFHLVGHSLGGMVALQYAVDRPAHLRSLAVLSTSSHNGRRASALGRVMSLLSRTGFEAAMAIPDVAAEVRALCDAVSPYAPQLLPVLARFTAEADPARALSWGATAGFSVRARLGNLACPALVVHGTSDPLMPLAAGQRIAEGVPGARWVTLEGAGHNLPERRAEEVTALLLGHLSPDDEHR